MMPIKNIAASITTITPSFLGGLRLRICLSKSCGEQGLSVDQRRRGPASAHNHMSIGASHNDREQALSSLSSHNG